ncbi:MAG: tRNA (N(6)-L-threonylcarbamoyladenosine(37)-C(2))-methylthiotransferase MtaB, partial [Patescibacteria group bacterium]|nr:tRNA (N(6)-L-threonylcarbamoyladenosine(37)-C(2))-methylthiotransferase MtaB [Patescibacteria group bacterium]
MEKINLIYKIYTLGCKVNQYDSADLKKRLNKVGFKEGENSADLAIVNTCAVTKTAIHKNSRMFNLAKKENPKAKIIVMGCWPETDDKILIKEKANLIWGVGDCKALIKQIKRFFPRLKEKNKLSNNIVSTNRSRYFLKIQDGCEQFCSYCIIPFARGKLKSRQSQEIITEAGFAIKNGFREIVLSGIHLGLYGREKYFKEKINLVELIKKLLEIDSLEKIRLSSIEVTEVKDELINLMRDNKKICKHLHIPLQNGSDKILKLMNRPYGRAYFQKKVVKLRKYMPDIALSTDVIVGFPGETEKDFQNTYNFIKKIKFSRLHVFPFSAHEKTKAFNFPNHLDANIIKERAKKLRELGKKLEKEYKQKFTGRDLAVIVEYQNNEYYIGKTEYYFDVKFKDGDIVDFCGNDDSGLVRK